ncbi:MAG: hypothetical protein MR654_08635 [Corynebacterium glucuronolyticum]|nr:hypothetical protein [Corynebacterium glucuronolyticum]
MVMMVAMPCPVPIDMIVFMVMTVRIRVVMRVIRVDVTMRMVVSFHRIS